MSDVPRRKLSELVLIYNLDPERRDVYVEGSFDEAVMKWFIHECDLHGVAVYPITALEIPECDLIAAGHKANNRERVVFLSEFLSSIAVQRAACVVDADFSRFRGQRPAAPPLYETDYACMEMYFFNPSSFTKFLMLCCNRSDWPVETIMDSLASVLQEFFLYRCANDELGWQMDWLDRITCMSIDGFAINLDVGDFVIRLLNKNGKASDKDAFVCSVDGLRPQLMADPRHQMNGHDQTSLLTWYIRKKGVSRERVRAGNVLVCMTMTLDLQALKQESLFSELAVRFA